MCFETWKEFYDGGNTFATGPVFFIWHVCVSYWRLTFMGNHELVIGSDIFLSHLSLSPRSKSRHLKWDWKFRKSNFQLNLFPKLDVELLNLHKNRTVNSEPDYKDRQKLCNSKVRYPKINGGKPKLPKLWNMIYTLKLNSDPNLRTETRSKPIQKWSTYLELF